MLVEMMHFLTPGGAMSKTCIIEHYNQTISRIKNNHRRFFSLITPTKPSCLILLGQGESAMQRQHYPATRVCRIHLTGLLDGGDFCHTAEEEKQISTLLWGVAMVDALQDAQVRPGIQLLGAGGLLLRRNRLVYHLKTMSENKITVK